MVLVPSSGRRSHFGHPSSGRSADQLASGRSTQRGLVNVPARGWITISARGEDLINKEVGHIPAIIRNRHLDTWDRQHEAGGLNSHREMLRAMGRDEEHQLDRCKDEALVTSLASDQRLTLSS